VRLGHVRTWGRWSEPGAVQAAAATPVTALLRGRMMGSGKVGGCVAALVK